MIVRNLARAQQGDRRIVAKTWESTRLLLRDDKMGFSFHITTIYAGTETPMCYRNHLEAVYCIAGEGELVSLDENQTYTVEPGMMYALDQHDRHILRATTELTMACVFNPPLHGTEVHDETGAYPEQADPIAAVD